MREIMYRGDAIMQEGGKSGREIPRILDCDQSDTYILSYGSLYGFERRRDHAFQAFRLCRGGRIRS